VWSAADSQASFLAQKIQLKWEVLRFLDWYAFLCKPTRQLQTSANPLLGSDYRQCVLARWRTATICSLYHKQPVP
jgi:hypothetical protein